MKKIILLLALLISVNAQAQKKGKKIYDYLFKYATVYSSYMEENGFDAPTEYFVTQGGEVQDITPEWDNNFNLTIGIRKVSRLGYQKKQGEFYTGDEPSSLNSNYSPVRGLEYVFQKDIGRVQNRDYNSHKYLVRYISKWWMIKGESLRNQKRDLEFNSADFRFRVPVSKRLSFNTGAVVRTHQAYGFNPIESYLATSPWWNLAYDYGYQDIYYGIDYDNDDVLDNFDWIWVDENGNLVADTDRDFRTNIYGDIVRDYNETEFDKIGTLGTLSLVVGADYYFYRSDFWFHTWASVYPGVHKHIIGDSDFSYSYFLDQRGEDVKYLDYNFGLNFGVRLWKRIGIFTEYEITKFWDRNISSLNAGINIRL